jgi:hypothetical protein
VLHQIQHEMADPQLDYCAANQRAKKPSRGTTHPLLPGTLSVRRLDYDLASEPPNRV